MVERGLPPDLVLRIGNLDRHRDLPLGVLDVGGEFLSGRGVRGDEGHVRCSVRGRCRYGLSMAAADSVRGHDPG